MSEVICTLVPTRTHAKLKEIAGYRSVEEWAQAALAQAAEQAQPRLTDSGLWRMHVSDWESMVSEAVESRG